jgi:hypothetical protein
MSNVTFVTRKTTREEAIRFIRENGIKVVDGRKHKFYQFVDFSTWTHEELFSVYAKVAKKYISRINQN